MTAKNCSVDQQTMNKEKVRTNIITDLLLKAINYKHKERTVTVTKQHTMQHSQTMDTQSNKQNTNMSTSLK